MGWDYRNKPVDVTAKEEIIKELTGDNENGVWKVLACAVKGNVAYCACEVTRKEKGKLLPKTRKVFATVVLFRNDKKDYYNFGTKVMDEGMGPYYYDCPAYILDMLPPTDNESAIEWREKCRKQITKKAATPKLESGDKVVFSAPLPFGAYGAVTELLCVDPKKLHFNASFGLCRLRRDTMKTRSYEHYRGGKLLASITA